MSKTVLLIAVDIFVVCADGLDSTIEVIAFNAVMWCHNISTTAGHLHPLVLGVKTAATYREGHHGELNTCLVASKQIQWCWSFGNGDDKDGSKLW